MRRMLTNYLLSAAFRQSAHMLLFRKHTKKTLDVKQLIVEKELIVDSHFILMLALWIGVRLVVGV